MQKYNRNTYESTGGYTHRLAYDKLSLPDGFWGTEHYKAGLVSKDF